MNKEIEKAIFERDAIWREHLKDILHYVAVEMDSISFLVFRATEELVQKNKEIRASLERKFEELKKLSGVDPSLWYLYMRNNPATSEYTLEETKQWLRRAADAAKSWTEVGDAKSSGALRKGRKPCSRRSKKKR